MFGWAVTTPMRRQIQGRTRTCTYHGVRNVSFSENFANVLNE